MSPSCPMSPRAVVWQVAGAPGAGKSTVAALLVERLRPVPAVLDKDTLFGAFVTAILDAASRQPGEREGPWYDQHIKAYEYDGLAPPPARSDPTAAPCSLEAPLTGPIHEPALWVRWVLDLGGEPVRLVWVRSDPATLRERLLRRGSRRDDGKLADFDAFLARMQPDTPPPVPHLEVDNRAGARPLPAQLDQMIDGAP